MRVTRQDIENAIFSEHYFTARDGCEGACGGGGVYPESLGLLTFCVLVLRNGFTVSGESACVDPAEFDAEVGRQLAREKALDTVWMLEGYVLKERMSQDYDAEGGEAGWVAEARRLHATHVVEPSEGVRQAVDPDA